MKNTLKKISAFAMAFTLLSTGTAITQSIAPTFDNSITASAANAISPDYYSYNGPSYLSFVKALKYIGVDTSAKNLKIIAKANGISNYNGSYLQDAYLLRLLKQGKLKKPSVVDIFMDIDADDWFVPDVQFVYNREIMIGKTKDIFDPTGLLLREEFVQALYNHQGKPSVSGTNPYPDVNEDAWYYNAVIWAKQNDIANGYGNGNFGVGDPITREQFALMLYKYAGLCGYDQTALAGKSSSYNDSSKISSWAKTAMDWVLTQDLLNCSDNKLDPQGNTTRAECAHSLKKLFERYE